MKEITVTFTPDELRELAKQLYLASFFLINYDYENQKVVDEIMNRVCAIGFHDAPETGGFRYGGPDEPIFYVSHEVSNESQPLVELFEDLAVAEQLPYQLADRDFSEQYGEIEAEEVFSNPELLDALHNIQKIYLDEFETYGVTHLRLHK
jgi:hypothetical protein